MYNVGVLAPKPPRTVLAVKEWISINTELQNNLLVQQWNHHIANKFSFCRCSNFPMVFTLSAVTLQLQYKII